MTMPETPAPRKNTTTIWIIIGVVVVVLICCALLAAVIVGGYYFLRINNRTVSGLQPFPIPFLSTPSPVNPAATPAAPTGTLQVEPFNPSTSTYPTLPNLIPGWDGLTGPGSQDWSVTVPSNQPVLVMVGWCTTTAQILSQNDQQIKWIISVDGQNVDVSKLYVYDEKLPDRVCRSSVGLIRQWPGGSHKIVTTMTLAQKINDGWNDYAAGDYTDTYNVTVGQ